MLHRPSCGNNACSQETTEHGESQEVTGEASETRSVLEQHPNIFNL